jgi:hypothetical protein
MLALAPRHRVGAFVMAVAAHDDLDRRRMGADAADDMGSTNATSARAGILPGAG